MAGPVEARAAAPAATEPAGPEAPGVAAQGRRFLWRRRRVLVALGGWSLLEAAHTFLSGYGVAKALDDGFLAGRTGTGLLWLAVAAAGTLLGGLAVRGVFTALAGLVEPFRDGLVRRAVSGALAAAIADPARADNSAVSRLTHQSEIARDSFAGLVLTARSFVFTGVGALVGLASLDPALLPVVLPPLLLGLALFLSTLAPMAAAQRAFLDADEALSDRVGAVGAGFRDVVACGGQGVIGAELDRLIAAEARLARRLARWAGVRTLALGAAGRLPVVALLLAIPWLLRGGATAGALLGALTYLLQALLPALHALMTAFGAAGSRLLVVLERFRADPALPDSAAPEAASAFPDPGPPGAASALPDPGPPGAASAAPDRVALGAAPPLPARVLSESAPAVPEPTAPEAVPVCPRPGPPGAAPAPTGPAAPEDPGPPAAELRGVTFAYGPGARPVLDRLDLTVRPGEWLAVVGPSGIGKSTLTALLAGLLAPDRGTVTLGGALARDPSGRAPLQRRTLLPQQAYVFSGTVRENLRYLSPDASAADLRRAVAALELDPLIDRLGGLEATVGPERLSAGERQRLALGRAHLSRAPLLLLDEATCHLDPDTEERAERALAARPGTTLVVVAHRISSALRADRVLLLDGDRALCAPHDELLARSALYRDLAGLWETG
ncbi:ATP-binding cassette domain-containing protein [Streptomyces pyxinae]|uniref:ATP-binding cassette domain-containing protein n=1 Tax=Streptomyces pyxinae TaxID=2970734 RepID=UPI003D17CD56